MTEPSSAAPVVAPAAVPPTEARQAELRGTNPPPSASSMWRPKPPSGIGLVFVLLLAVGGVAAVLAAWRLPPFATAAESTDNAYVRGRTTVISPQVSGYVTKVLVRDFDSVVVGQPLVTIDDRIYRERVDQAAAQVDAAQATLANSLGSTSRRNS